MELHKEKNNLPARHLHRSPSYFPVRALRKLCSPLFVRLVFVALEEGEIPVLCYRICKIRIKQTIEQLRSEQKTAEPWSSKTLHAMLEATQNCLIGCGLEWWFLSIRIPQYPILSDFHSHFVHPLNSQPFLASHH